VGSMGTLNPIVTGRMVFLEAMTARTSTRTTPVRRFAVTVEKMVIPLRYVIGNTVSPWT